MQLCKNLCIFMQCVRERKNDRQTYGVGRKLKRVTDADAVAGTNAKRVRTMYIVRTFFAQKGLSRGVVVRFLRVLCIG